jgi:peptidoglycan hydrolase CwlO-like protein
LATWRVWLGKGKVNGIMTIEVALVISAISVAFSVYSGIANMKRNQKTDSQKDTSEMTTVIVKLENISTGITEIKTEFNSMKSELKEVRDRLIIVEQSLKSAWKRIEYIKTNDVN